MWLLERLANSLNLIRCWACAITLMLFSALSQAQPAPVLLGQTVALSGPIELHGKGLQMGIKAAFEQYNARDPDRPLKLISLDDKANAQLAGENAKTLVETHGVVALVGGAEGGPCVSVLDIARKSATPQVGCAGGSPELREGPKDYSFPVRAPHLLEFERIILQGTTLGEKRFAFVHADSTSGRRHLENVKSLAAQYGAELVAAIPLTKETTPQSALAQLSRSGAKRVFNHGSINFFAELRSLARRADMPVNFSAVNSGMQILLSGKDAREAEGLEFTQVVPSPFRKIGIAAKYQEAMDKYFPGVPYGTSSFEGYITGRIVILAIKKAKKPLTKASLAAALGNISGDVDGFYVNMVDFKKRGSQFVDIGIVRKNGSTAF